MTKQRADHIKEFHQKVKSANKEATKKEAFKDLLNRLYADNEETKTIIDAITSGAEATVLNIPRKDKIHRGSADTLYNKIIIEFENYLKKTEKHAKEQLAGYLLGKFRTEDDYSPRHLLSAIQDGRRHSSAPCGIERDGSRKGCRIFTRKSARTRTQRAPLRQIES